MSLAVVQGGRKFTCPANDCQKELEYKLTSQDLDRGTGHIRCPDCGLTIFFKIQTNTQSGQVEIEGPKVLLIA